MYNNNIILAAIIFMITGAIFSQDYCSIKNKNTYDISIFGESYVNKEDQRNMLKGIGLTLNFDKLQMGDKIKITIFNGSEAIPVIDKCFPGCPDKGLINSLIDSECSKQVARQDKVQLKKTIRSIIKKN